MTRVPRPGSFQIVAAYRPWGTLLPAPAGARAPPSATALPPTPLGPHPTADQEEVGSKSAEEGQTLPQARGGARRSAAREVMPVDAAVPRIGPLGESPGGLHPASPWCCKRGPHKRLHSLPGEGAEIEELS
jgi:hypothetical protein